MGNGSEIPHDLLELIAKRVNKFEDFVRFRAVCKSWHAAAEKENFKGLPLREHIPYLMLVAEGDEREFYSLQEHKIVAKVTLPCLKGKKCIESLGWLLLVGREGDMSLLNPFTGVEIELPHYKTFPDVNGDYFMPGEPFFEVQRMVLSSRPDKSSDFVVMIIAGMNHSMGFWRPGDHQWNSPDECMGDYCDVTYLNGKFYAIHAYGCIVVFDLAGPNPRTERFINLIKNDERCDEIDVIRWRQMNSGKSFYIVEFSGALLVIARDARQYNEVTQSIFYNTRQVQLFIVDPSSGRWEEIYSLGNKAAFVGHSSTTLVETSKFNEFKANHLYYTIDCSQLNDLFRMQDPRRSSRDIGVYNLETKNAEPFYHGDEGKFFIRRNLFSQLSPAVWVTPRFEFYTVCATFASSLFVGL